MPGISFAVVSDLHCHSAPTDKSKKRSFLTVEQPRVPASRHPFQSLLELIRTTSLAADYLVCPGDISDRTCTTGLVHGWDVVNQIGHELGANDIISTLGNHDVDSRRKHDSDPFRYCRTFSPYFPSCDSEQNELFWGQGFCVPVKNSQVAFISLNSTHGHMTAADAKRGMFEEDRIEALDKYLSKQPKSALTIAVVHHHPILHSYAEHSSIDVLANGDGLLSVLASHGCKFIVHGHRHQARLNRRTSDGRQILVLAAGSFSAFLNELFSITRNLFHVVHIEPCFDNNYVRGVIRTWEFNYGRGWNRATRQSAEFPHQNRFGPTASPTIYKDILCALENCGNQYISGDDLERRLEGISHLTLHDLLVLRTDLEDQHNIRMEIDEYGFIQTVGYIRNPKRRNAVATGSRS